VAQVDRFQAGYRGDGDWSSTKRFYVTLDPDLNRVHSQEVADLGEVNMADGDTLVDFATWAIDTFPADKYVLILSDHGMGWPGGWTDPAPGGRGGDNVALADMGDALFLMELDGALQKIRDQTGLDQFELIGLDACLMGHLEVFDALAPHARYAVASQETEPALGWAYTGFLGALRDNPDMDGAELGRAIVDSYVQEDQRIVDDQARAEFLSRGSPLSSLFGMPSAEQLAQQMEDSATLAAVDLQHIPVLMNRVNELSYALQGASQKGVAKARSYAQSFTSVFGKEVPPSYLDLGHLAELLKAETGSRDVANAADGVLTALGQVVVAEKHGPQKPAAYLSIFPIRSFTSHGMLAPSLIPLSPSVLPPSRCGTTSSTITTLVNPLSSVRVSSPCQSAARQSPDLGPERSKCPPLPSRPIRSRLARRSCSAPTFAGRTPATCCSLPAFSIRSPTPSLWPTPTIWKATQLARSTACTTQTGARKVSLPWSSSGSRSCSLSMTEWIRWSRSSIPRSVGRLPSRRSTRSKGPTRYARLYFSNGVLTQVLGYTGQDGTGAPREIIPSAGDTFTVLDKWLDLNERGEVEQTVRLPGDTLTFSGETFSWEALDAAAGQYVVGFIVQDLDGNSYESFGVATVE
jgi:hypothetical protein